MVKETAIMAAIIAWGWIIDTLNTIYQYVFMAVAFSFLRIVLLGDRTPREAFMTYIVGAILGTTVGISLEHMGFNQGTIYLVVSGVVLLSENILQAIIYLGAQLSKDPQKFIRFWVGIKKDMDGQ